jgi:aerobic carbon-monoxide dehydrogenase small subunit
VNQIALTVNGAAVEGLVEPRLHLADFLREQQRLTGTHLGCEQGVCGACTVLLNGAPARSCLTFAIACNGAEVRTVEGFGDDPVMARLRDAFGAEHALQCGFCTPGMLISSYDIVRRLPRADEARIRTELSGNLCRCTGYMGIVAAVKRVLAEAPATQTTPSRVPAHTTPVSPPPPAGEGRAGALSAPRSSPTKPAAAIPHSDPPPQAEEGITAVVRSPIPATTLEPGWTRIADSFIADIPPETVWALFGDVPRVASCLPGTMLEDSNGPTLKGRMQVKIGPIGATFTGTATHERDAASQTGVLSGSGGDQRSNSRARGRVTYRLLPEDGGRRTRVELTLDFLLQGVLAQFSRSGLVKDLVGRMVRDFTANLAATLAGGGKAAAAPAPLKAGNLVWAVLWARLKALLGLSS